MSANRNRQRNYRRRLKARLHRTTKSPKLLASLLAAAIAIPGLGGLSSVHAQTAAPDSATIRLEYGDFQDFQDNATDGSGRDRMHIRAPMLWFETPVGADWAIEGSAVVDTLSGASPYYLSSLSGASGLKVKDQREAVDLKVTKFFDDFSIGLAGNYSDEDDYRSKGGQAEISFWNSDKSRIFTFGMGESYDTITSTDNPFLDETRRTYSFVAGLTQIINPRSIFQTNVTLSTGDGYFTDSYKPYDLRPQSRDQYALLSRYNYHFDSLSASLHADYRYFWDSWNLHSHTFELAWYQSIGSSWVLKPNIRYYSQDAAEFFDSVYPPEDSERFYSADHRLSSFGGITTGLKLIKDFGSGWSADVAYALLQQRAGFKLGGQGTSGVEPYYAKILTLGITKKF